MKNNTSPARVRSMLDNSAFDNNKLFQQIHNLEISHLETKLVNSSIEHLIARLVLFASSYGFLCESRWMLLLINNLLTEKLVIKNCSFGIYIEIFELNENHGLIAICHPRRWFIDVMSLAVIYQIQQRIKSQPIQPYRSEPKLYQMLFNLQNKDPLEKLSTLKKFCSASADYAAQSLQPCIPMYLVAYAKGQLKSFSTSPISFSRLVVNQKANNAELQCMKVIDTESIWIQPDKNEFDVDNYKSALSHAEDVISKLRHRFDNKKPIVGQIDNLQRYSESLRSTPDYILATWLLSLLRKERKVTTASRYLSAVGSHWLTHLYKEDILEMTESEITGFRDAINGQSNSKESFAYNESVLNRLLKYSNKNHSTVLPIDCHIGEDNDPRPRNYVVAESDFQRLLNSIKQTSSFGSQYTNSLFIAVLIMGRCGLRPHEVVSLMLIDVEPSEELLLFIRPNRFETTKTYSAKRVIPLHLLLKPDEFEFFKSYYNKRMTQHKVGMNNPLLLPPDISSNMTYAAGDFDEKVSDKLSEICGCRVVTYHLRHTALSKLQIVVLTLNQQSVKLLTPYTGSEAKNIKDYLTKNSDRNDCWNISGVAGHLDFSMSSGVYLHFTDILLSEYIDNIPKLYTRIFWQNISGLKPTSLSRKGIIIETSCVDFKPLIVEKFGLTNISNSSNKEFHDNNRNTLVITRKLIYKDCISVLKMIDKGHSINEVALALDIEIADIDKWLEKAQKLKKICSSRGKPRLTSSTKSGVSPTRPPCNSEMKRAEKIMNKIRTVYINSKDDIHWFIQYTITNVSHGHSYIDFSCPDNFQRYLDIALKATKITDWDAEYTPSGRAGAPKSYWLGNFKAINVVETDARMQNRNMFPHGQFKLFFINKYQKPTSGSKRYSSNVIKYICHVLAITCPVDLSMIKCSDESVEDNPL